ncbi:MAG: extracellular solute-binding protein [Clostridia bacterium]|nr:extracellular solute-binding protein [Clostridia bacterium]
MKKHLRALNIMLCVVIAFCAFTSCTSAPESADESAPPTIKILLRGDEQGLERVINKLYEQMDAEHSWKLEINLTDVGSYGNELNRVLTSHEDYSLVFDAPWISLSAMSQSKSYLDLEKYFCNVQYSGLYESFEKEYLDANRIDGKLYAIPITNSYYDPTGVFYRRDILRECALGFTEISSREQLWQFYDAVLEQFPDIAPISIGNRGFYLLNSLDLSMRNDNLFDVTGWSFFDYPAKIVLDESCGNVVDVVFAGDESSHFAALDTPYNTDFMAKYLLDNAACSVYAQEDSMFAVEGRDAFVHGQSASYEAAIGTGGSDAVQKILAQNAPNAEVGFWCYEPSLNAENREEAGIISTMQAWNFLCVPSYSTSVDETMRFLDWLYSSRDRLDLFTYGVEGEDWLADGENGYIMLDNPEGTYSFPAYSLSWNLKYQRIGQTLPENEKSLLEYTYNTENYTPSPLAGWTLDTTKISIELAQLTALYSEYSTAFSHGLYGDSTQQKIAALHSKSQELGLETVRQEIKRQAQAYLDT